MSNRDLADLDEDLRLIEGTTLKLRSVPNPLAYRDRVETR